MKTIIKLLHRGMVSLRTSWLVRRVLPSGMAVLLCSTLVLPISSQSSEPQPLRSIGISVADLGNPYFVKLVDAATSKAQALANGPVKMLIRSDAYDWQRQIEQLNDFIEQDVDLIVLTAADEYKVAPVVAKAQRAGIKVIAVDVNADGADATITTDNVQAGVVACERLAKKTGYKGNFVIINGVLVSSVIERVAGCKSTLNKYPNIHLLSDRMNGTGSVEGGMEAMTYLMEEYDHIDAVFTINDPTALGVLRAAKQAQRDEFLLASVDGAPFAEDLIKQPNNPWIATAVQRPVQMAEKAIEIGMDLLAGKDVPQRFILIPSVLFEKN
ncbi:substrate-binding domain-containing protein [Marinomonas posidonica]|uniref:Periplasmic binding protein/LacI transcriptional regulator n=1 Tax=Marinomonas posidonica (strain CECT 7376 / NCIMB 14433 / IVIA-Po-181) TaxID=491952 RepID=F6CTS3_MARPP|nr:substrate-binding domain-containing protein [Marinomonas posidonica]AEF56292.1 periplasmic binding protein/LacI transcriptional regulator [Marinomonas posidonica IVIA-Po-181]